MSANELYWNGGGATSNPASPPMSPEEQQQEPAPFEGHFPAPTRHHHGHRPRHQTPSRANSPAFLAQAKDSAPPTPPSTTAVPTTLDTDDEDEKTELGSPPSRAPPQAPPPHFQQFQVYDDVDSDVETEMARTKARRHQHQQQPQPMQPYAVPDTPAESTLSQQLRAEQHRDQEPAFQYTGTSAGEHPVYAAPPSPPPTLPTLTRQSTTISAASTARPELQPRVEECHSNEASPQIPTFEVRPELRHEPLRPQERRLSPVRAESRPGSRLGLGIDSRSATSSRSDPKSAELRPPPEFRPQTLHRAQSSPTSQRSSQPAGVREILLRSTLSGRPRATSKDVQEVGEQLGQNPIDYLVPHGSLPAPISMHFHLTHPPTSLDAPEETAEDDGESPIKAVFGNLNFLLDSYLEVLSAGGSMSVASGYRSVARRLLERVEGLFGRDLGVEGAGWADVLEYIRGSRQRPCLCVLPVRGLLASKREEEQTHQEPDPTTTTTAKDFASSVLGSKPASGKVEQWLEQVEKVLKQSADTKTSPTAAQEAEEDRTVIEIIEGILGSSASSSGSTQIKSFRRYLEDPALLESTKLALTRLYPDNAPSAITPPIIALYLLLHPDLRTVLAAVANVTDAELELINSGRFDAFLDGAGNAVGRDEEEELKVCGKLDRHMCATLDELDTEIEELQMRALIVRQALKARQDGILRKRPEIKRRNSGSSVGSSRRGGNGRDSVDIERTASPLPDREEQEWELSWPARALEILPDDSASNITSNRRRKERKVLESESERRHTKEEREAKKARKEARRKEEEEFRERATGKREKVSRMEFGFESLGRLITGAGVDEDGLSLSEVGRRRREREAKREEKEKHRERKREREEREKRKEEKRKEGSTVVGEGGVLVDVKEREVREAKEAKEAKSKRAS